MKAFNADGVSNRNSSIYQGTLSFSKNGKDFGIAYKEEAFKRGEFFAAVAPIYTGDSFELVQPQLED